MKILVIGHARHGKDTVCELLAQKTHLSFVPTSDLYIDNIVWPALKYQYDSKEDLIKDKANIRPLLFSLISEYCKNDKARFAKLVLSKSNIYCGIRARAEFNASKNLFDLIVWVDASDRIKLESKKSFELNYPDANWFINNNSDIKNLELQVDKLSHFIRAYDSYARVFTTSI